MPPTGCPNGEKLSVLMPFAVIVTTDFCASAMTAVRSMVWTVVALVVRAALGSVGVEDDVGSSSCTARAVPPAARTALRAAATSTVPTPFRPPPLPPRPPFDAAGGFSGSGAMPYGAACAYRGAVGGATAAPGAGGGTGWVGFSK